MTANEALKLNLSKPIGERSNAAETMFQANKTALWNQIMGEVETVREKQREQERE